MTQAWTWLRERAWWVLVALLGLLVLVAAVFLGGAARARLLAWWHGLRADRATFQAEAAKARADGLDAQRARLLHEATEAAKARAQLQAQDQELRVELEEAEERIQAMSAEEVAAEFNRLRGNQ